jgi:hypothetical protein
MKLVALLILLTGWITDIQPHSDMIKFMTWEGETDGVKTWVTVIARERQFTPEQLVSNDWNDWGNTETDAYLFAFDNPENVHLILTFDIDHELGSPIASVYLNDFGRLPLSYELTARGLNIISNNGYPYLTIHTKTGGWWVNDLPNYNLEILVDGLRNNFGLTEEFNIDGRVDQVIWVGSNALGEPVWETTELINDPHPTWGYTRFDARMRFQSKKTGADHQEGIFKDFPYFYIAKKGQNYFTDQVFPLFFDLRTYEFQLHNFVGFQDGGIWAVNSLSKPPDIDFEAPFVFYNFNTSNNYADLVIRSGYFSGGSVFFYMPEHDLATNKIRYSWKTNSSLDWHYGIHTVGLKDMPEMVAVGDHVLHSVLPDHLPGWVIDNDWPIIHFIEAIEGYPGSEGIYFFGGRNQDIFPWVIGRRDTIPDYLDQPYLPTNSELTYLSDESIPLGFRAEFTWGGDVNPVLYISPMDQRVHLLNAKGGTWNLSEDQMLRYENRSGDAYIDTWILEDVLKWSEDELMRLALETSVDQAIYHIGDHLLFSSDQEVIIINQTTPHEILRIKPPTDQASWEDFRDTVTPITDSAPSPNDLGSWIKDLRGPRVHLSGVSIYEVNNIKGNSTIILEVTPDYQVKGDLEGPWTHLSPGKNTTQLRDNQWHIQPFVPPNVYFVRDSLIYSSPSFRVNQPIQIITDIGNSGDTNSGPLAVELWASEEGQPAELVVLQDLILDPAQTKKLQLVWRPQNPGNYELELRFIGDSVEASDPFFADLKILPNQDAQLTRAARLSLPTQPAFLIALLASLSLSSVLFAAVVIKLSFKR